MNIDIKSINFNEPKFKLVGGLSIQGVKIKYNWLFNAQMKDAIIGEDDNGLVWYSGTWVCGVWEDGTWYSGDFLEGRWKDGKMYSYYINDKEASIGNLEIIRTDISKTRFHSGTFEGGEFHYGIFGNVQIDDDVEIPYLVDKEWVIENITDYNISGETLVDNSGVTITTATFEGGEFLGGLMNSSYINGGYFYNDIANNVIWKDGKWYGGCFLIGDWYGGEFLGGDFSNGNWYGGTLSSNSSIKTRFGCDYKNGSVNWYDGLFSNAQLYSGISEETEVGVIQTSSDNSILNWYDGTFINGDCYGGTIHNGVWETGTLYGGIVLDLDWKNGHIVNCIWESGTFENGTISGGIFKNIISTNIKLGYDI